MSPATGGLLGGMGGGIAQAYATMGQSTNSFLRFGLIYIPQDSRLV